MWTRWEFLRYDVTYKWNYQYNTYLKQWLYLCKTTFAFGLKETVEDKNQNRSFVKRAHFNVFLSFSDFLQFCTSLLSRKQNPCSVFKSQTVSTQKLETCAGNAIGAKDREVLTGSLSWKHKINN